MTDEIIAMSKRKTKLYRRKQNNPTQSNIDEYNTLNNYFNKHKRYCKSQYMEKLLIENKNNIKRTWAILNEVMGRRTSKSKQCEKISDNDVLITDKSVIAEKFNEHFSNIGTRIASNITKPNHDYFKTMPNRVKSSMFLEPVMPHEILTSLTKLKPKSSTGFDDISCKIIKESSNYIIEPLAHVINLSFKEGIFPDNMKIAKVVPIFKNGDPLNIENYRPVSLLPAFSKIIERLVFNRLSKFLNTNDLLYKHQYGFRSNHNTIQPIIHFLTHCANANNKVKPELTLAIFCDLSKAFDVINHQILLDKMNMYGIRGIVHKWFQSYLHKRTQFVTIANDKSNRNDITRGVPQGSILGPLLFLIYMNDISNACDVNLLSFADDTTIYMSSASKQHLFTSANCAMKALSDWFAANELYLNAKKTNYMIISPSQIHTDTSELELKIGNTTIERVGQKFPSKSTKFLGIHLDDHLTWKHHISYINSKIRKTVFAMNQSKRYLPETSLIHLYLTLVQPYLTYGIQIWGSANSSALQKTIIIQKRAMRIINTAKYNSHTEPLFKKCEILKLPDLYEHQISIFMYDFINRNLPRSFDSMFQLISEKTPNLHTRQSRNLDVPIAKNKFVSSLPTVRYPQIINKHIDVLYDSKSRFIFKRKLKTKIITDYASSVKCRYKECKDCYGK